MDEWNEPTEAISVIEARMESRRLPGRPLRLLAGLTVLEEIALRAGVSQWASRLLVVTSPSEEDRPIRLLCEEVGLEVLAVEPTRELSALLRCAEQAGARCLAHIPADTVLLDPKMLDACARYALDSEMDSVTVRRLPQGVAVEAVPARTLHHLVETTSGADSLADAVACIAAHPERFERALLPAPPRLNRPELCLALETEHHYHVLRQLYDAVPPGPDGIIPVTEALAYLDDYMMRFLGYDSRRQAA